MDDLKNAVKLWAKQVGKGEAVSRLVAAGLSSHFAEKLVSGRYDHNPRKFYRQAILDAMNGESSKGKTAV